MATMTSNRTGLLEEAFLETAARVPENIAVISRRRTLRYGELEQLARSLAAQITSLAPDSGQPVAVLLPKGWEQVPAVLAALLAGVPYLPVDPDLPEQRRNWILNNAGVRVALTSQDLAAELRWPEGVTPLAVDTHIVDPKAEPRARARTASDAGYVMYTSGSTGLPKGARIAHEGIVHCMAETNRAFAVTEGDRAIAITALHHDMSVYDLFGMLGAGAALVMPEAEEARNPAAWLALMATHRVTIWNSVPAFLGLLLEEAEHARASLGSLRLIFSGGDWIPLTAPARARRLAAPGLEFVSVGGPTETTVWNIWYRVGEVRPEWRSIPYGRPIAGVRYHIVRDGRECAPGEAGELCCSGLGVMLGYVGDAALTESRFLTLADGQRVYRTGDLGRLMADGEIEFLGREDTQVKIAGLRVELGEIEACLNRLPGVESAVVLARERQGEKQLVAAVRISAPAPAGAAALTPAEIAGQLREELPAVMIPALIEVVAEFPLTANGKLDRAAVLRLLEQKEQAAADAPARPPAEGAAVREKILAVWKQVLAVEEVGLDTNFFDLGGRSMHLMQVRAILAARHAIQIPVTEMLRHPTVRRLAEFAEGGGDRRSVEAATLDRAALQRAAMARRRAARG